MKNKAHWTHFSHDADMGIRGLAPTLEGAFEMGGLALTSIVTSLPLINPVEEITIHLEASYLDLLFLDWINAIIYEMDVRRMLFSEFSVRIQKLILCARLKGEHLDRTRHVPVVEVKGATLTELKVFKNKKLWIAQCVVDV